jgi:hypothetical protein
MLIVEKEEEASQNDADYQKKGLSITKGRGMRSARSAMQSATRGAMPRIKADKSAPMNK